MMRFEDIVHGLRLPAWPTRPGRVVVRGGVVYVLPNPDNALTLCQLSGLPACARAVSRDPPRDAALGWVSIGDDYLIEVFDFHRRTCP